jgi:integrase
MRNKFTLLQRVREEKNGKPVYAVKRVPFKNGKPIKPTTGTSFYLRYSANGQRKLEALGSDFDVAATALLNHEARQEYVKRGLPVPISNESRLTVTQAADDFKARLIALGSHSERTIKVYSATADDFRNSCTRTYVDEVGEDEIIAFINWLRKNLRHNAVGDPNSTIQSRLKYVRRFLLSTGVITKFPLPKKQWPRVETKKVTRYSKKDIEALMAAANVDEADLIQFLLRTGFRNGEAAHARYSDFDWQQSITVKEKPGWKIKDRTQRTIPLTKEFLKRMKARRERYPESDLIFPNTIGKANGKPNVGKANGDYLLKRIREVAKRAGITETSLHKFRRTFGTLAAKKHGVRTAQEWLGHEDIETTMAYLAADKFDTPKETNAAAKAIFEGFGD